MSITLHPEFVHSDQDPYLLALSGGRDSVALLHLLLSLGVENLVLCHVNHGLRGEESDLDAAFVEALAKKHQLRCEISKIDVKQRMCDKGESMELAARLSRHEYFAYCASKHECRRVLLAHHADDQAETVLFKLLRGSGGLQGMTYSRRHTVADEELELLRPLLLTPREEINQYIKTHGITYREDLSNAEAVAVRNRLRNEVMPLLNDIMKRDVSMSINRAVSISALQDKALREALQQHEVEDPQGRLFLPVINTLPAALKYLALHDYLKKQGVSNISYQLLDECLDILSEQTSSKVNLPGGRFFRRKQQRAFVE